MKKVGVVIATSTLYPSLEEVRPRLAIKTAKISGECGYPIVVVDASPDKRVTQALEQAGAIVFKAQDPGMGPSRRQALQEAAKIAGQDGILAWLEPEKATFVPFLAEVVKYLLSQQADIVIPRRKSLESYPEFQQHFEWLNNYIFQIYTERDLDHCVGVRVFRSDITPFFLNYRGEYGDKWDSLIVPLLRIIGAGKRVVEVEIDYVHPPEQTATEGTASDFEHRLEQLINTVRCVSGECNKG